jgi:hypothetical protein
MKATPLVENFAITIVIAIAKTAEVTRSVEILLNPPVGSAREAAQSC